MCPRRVLDKMKIENEKTEKLKFSPAFKISTVNLICLSVDISFKYHFFKMQSLFHYGFLRNP